MGKYERRIREGKNGERRKWNNVKGMRGKNKKEKEELRRRIMEGE